MKNLILIFSLLSVFSIGSIVGIGLEVNPIVSGLTAVGIGLVTGYYKFVPQNVLGASICGGIAKNIDFSCTVPLQSGTRERAWLINFEDIDSVTYNATNPKIVEAITLKAGKVAYYIDGKNNSISPKAMMVGQTYGNQFDHSVKMIGFDISPDTKDHLDKGKDGKYVVITENNFKGANGNSAFEIYGLTVGMEFSILERDPNNVETMGAFDFTLITKVNKEPGLPHNFFDTSYSASKAAIEALLV